MFPERLHVVAFVVDVTTRLLETLEGFFTDAADEVDGWSGPVGPALIPATRQRLTRIQQRAQARRARMAAGVQP